MSAHSQPPVGIDHPTVVPVNFEPESADASTDDRPADDPAGSDERAEK